MTDSTTTTDLHCPAGVDACPIHEEIAAIREEIKSLRNQVLIDDLTGLFNHRHFVYSLEQEIERTYRSMQPTTLILLDIDHFKQVNDDYGHVVGDKVLRMVGATIGEAVRKIDIACRYGGEEFAVILPATSTMVGVQVAKRIREKIEALQVAMDDGRSFSVTVSGGVDSFTGRNEVRPEELVARADNFLYEAKNQGRNRICHPHYKISDLTLVSEEEKSALFDTALDKDGNNDR